MAAIKQRKNRGLLTVSAAVTVLAGIAAGILITMGMRGEELLHSDVIFPNISIAGIPVGGMTAGEAQEAVNTAFQTRYTTDFAVHLPDRTLVFEADKLSPAADTGDAVTRAMAYGRKGTAFDALAAQNEVIDLPAKATVTFDEAYIRQILEEAAEEVSAEAVLPTAELNHREKVITVTLGTDGQRLDTQNLCTAVLNALSAGETALSWSYTAVSAGVPDLEALHEAVGRSFDLADAQAQMAACEPGESFSIAIDQP